MSEYSFDGIDELKRNREIEGKTGIRLEFPGGRWIQVLAATDANPKWVARRDIITRETRRLANAKADDARYREFIVPHLVAGLCIDWGGWKNSGVEIPFSAPACKALLMEADDAYAAIMGVMNDDKNYRANRVEVLVAEAGE